VELRNEQDDHRKDETRNHLMLPRNKEVSHKRTEHHYWVGNVGVNYRVEEPFSTSGGFKTSTGAKEGEGNHSSIVD